MHSAAFELTDLELLRKGTSTTVGLVFDRHARELRQRLLAETFATAWRRRRRAHLVDALAVHVPQRPWAWMRYVTAAAMVVSLVVDHIGHVPFGGR
jgi:hypothetical protein